MIKLNTDCSLLPIVAIISIRTAKRNRVFDQRDLLVNILKRFSDCHVYTINHIEYRTDFNII